MDGMNRWMVGREHEWIDEQMDRFDEYMDGLMNKWMALWTDRWTDVTPVLVPVALMNCSNDFFYLFYLHYNLQNFTEGQSKLRSLCVCVCRRWTVRHTCATHWATRKHTHTWLLIYDVGADVKSLNLPKKAPSWVCMWLSGLKFTCHWTVQGSSLGSGEVKVWALSFNYTCTLTKDSFAENQSAVRTGPYHRPRSLNPLRADHDTSHTLAPGKDISGILNRQLSLPHIKDADSLFHHSHKICRYIGKIWQTAFTRATGSHYTADYYTLLYHYTAPSSTPRKHTHTQYYIITTPLYNTTEFNTSHYTRTSPKHLNISHHNPDLHNTSSPQTLTAHYKHTQPQTLTHTHFLLYSLFHYSGCVHDDDDSVDDDKENSKSKPEQITRFA